MDLGVSADVAGSFFYEMVRGMGGFLVGASMQARVDKLWKLLKSMYVTFNTPCRLQALTVDMICKKAKGSKPKLRAKAGEMRHS